MITHLDRYLSGSAFFVHVIYRKGGKRVSVFDRTARWRPLARKMCRSGLSVGQVAARIGRDRAAVERALAVAFPRRAIDWK